MITPLILCGGSGTRLWPASRRACPKQFLPLIRTEGDGGVPRSTYQATLLRVAGEGFARPVVVTGNAYRFMAAGQARDVGVEIDILLEPEGRDSGPAFAAAAAHLARRDGEEAVGLMLAADHQVRDAAGFRATCEAALPAARGGRIVTFGIVPTHPSPDFGYIAPGEPLGSEPIAGGVRAVERFREKPDAGTARDLIARGHVWNSGNFLARADVLLAEYAACDPETVKAAREAVARGRRDPDFLRLDASSFARAARLSIDHAVMERTGRAAVVAARFDWSDIGGWDAMGGVLPADEAGNAYGCPLVAHEASRNVAVSDGPLVALAGVEDLAVVVTDDAVLVTRRDAGHLMRGLVAKVREARPELVDAHSGARERGDVDMSGERG